MSIVIRVRAGLRMATRKNNPPVAILRRTNPRPANGRMTITEGGIPFGNQSIVCPVHRTCDDLCVFWFSVPACGRSCIFQTSRDCRAAIETTRSHARNCSRNLGKKKKFRIPKFTNARDSVVLLFRCEFSNDGAVSNLAGDFCPFVYFFGFAALAFELHFLATSGHPVMVATNALCGYGSTSRPGSSIQPVVQSGRKMTNSKSFFIDTVVNCVVVTRWSGQLFVFRPNQLA